MLLCLCTGITMKPDNSEAVNLESRYSLENLMGKMGWDFSAINYCCPAGAVCLTAQLQEQTTYVLLTLCKVRELSVNLHRSIWPWGRAVALLSSPLQWGIYSSEGYSSLQHHPHHPQGPQVPQPCAGGMLALWNCYLLLSGTTRWWTWRKESWKCRGWAAQEWSCAANSNFRMPCGQPQRWALPVPPSRGASLRETQTKRKSLLN